MSVSNVNNRIEICNLKFSYDRGSKKPQKYVLKDISMSVKNGQSVGIIGANGVGKSTFLKILVGLLHGYEGRITVDKLEINQENMPQIRRKMGYVFQDSDSQLFMNTVYEDVLFGPLNYGMKSDEAAMKAVEALKRTHIEKLADRHIYRLSGGEKKLAAIAGILAVGTDIMLMDEPSAALDPANRDNLIHILRELGGTKLIASHDLDFIYDTCDRTILLSDGLVAFDGDTNDILRDKSMLEANGLRLPLSFRFVT